jgi:TrmH family RNA methyltransferase
MKQSFSLITSVNNQRIKDVCSLRDRRDRDRTDCFIIEGYRELLRAVDAQFPMAQLFICPEYFLGENEQHLISRLASAGAEIFTCSKPVFSKLSYRDRPDGLLAVAPQKHLGLDDLDKRLQNISAPFMVIAEAIEKPGNLGTILRSSDAVGVDGLVVCDRCTDIYNPNTVRASVGTLFTVPVVDATSEECLSWLKKKGVLVVAATPSGSQEYTAVDLTGPLAIAVGAEQFGLSEKWMNEADIRVNIPMRGVADSLNVAMATTLLLYEVLRQRGAKNG